MRSRLRGIALALATAAAVVSLVTPPPAMGAIEPYVGVAITFERGCPRGEGTLEVINATTGVDVIERGPVLWRRDGKLRWQATGFTVYPISTYDGNIILGDRLVVRLLSADGRLLFTSEVPFFPEADKELVDGQVLPDYRLTVRLDCSRIPYRVAAQIPWPPYMPATSTASSPPESPPVPLILVASFGLAFAGAWRYLSRRSQPDA